MSLNHHETTHLAVLDDACAHDDDLDLVRPNHPPEVRNSVGERSLVGLLHH